MREMYELRCLLEPAALRNAIHQVTRSDIEAMRERTVARESQRDWPAEAIDEILAHVVAADYQIEHRMTLDVVVIQDGEVLSRGWALNEAYLFDRDGRMENAGFLDYRMPVASDLPMIDTILVEVQNPRHPFGAKGVGETPIVPPLAAAANAVRSATGLRLNDLPLAPPVILAASDLAKAAE
jgi:hypothetical protein